MIRKYGFFGFIRLLFSLIYTKIFITHARLVRLPFDIRNKRFIDLGSCLTTGVGCRIEAFPTIKESKKIILKFGNNIEINDYVHIAAGSWISIGNNVLIASKVFISDINHGNYTSDNQDSPLSIPKERNLSTNPVIIEDNVWIGESVCVLPGVRIGRGSIIGSLSVVTKNIPEFSIAVGSPAKVVKKYCFHLNKWIKVES
jgi:lipopolysaccharide O-acetyltransferase